MGALSPSRCGLPQVTRAVSGQASFAALWPHVTTNTQALLSQGLTELSLTWNTLGLVFWLDRHHTSSGPSLHAPALSSPHPQPLLSLVEL